MGLWWTRNKWDDVFWRTAGSGGRATVRGKRGAETTGHYGDLTAAHEVAAPFLRVFTIELKRGYNRDANLHDLIDFRGKVPNPITGFFEQARTSAVAAGTPFWMVIWKRDRRRPIVFVQEYAAGALCLTDRGFEEAIFNIGIERVFVFDLETFLAYTRPRDVAKYADQIANS